MAAPCPRLVSGAALGQLAIDVETFVDGVLDPCCGGGNIVRSARAHGLVTQAWDIADRGFPHTVVQDFLDPGPHRHVGNIVTNPPFAIARQIAEHALQLAIHKVALLFPVARLNAARWLEPLPLKTVWLLTPRPSMPPGETILRGEKPGGGKMDYCWLVFERGHQGAAAMQWLHRDGK
jgi:hypothetical protein